MNIAFIAAVNDASVLASNLQSSPDARKHTLYPMEGFSTAGSAYNAALDSTSEEILIFLHQDVFLPPGWLDQIISCIVHLNRADPQWAVLGVVGVDFEGKVVGRTYSSGLRKVVGHGVQNPVPAKSLDEIVLILRRDSGVRFDAELPGFHLYGTDICQAAITSGCSCYVVDGFCIHNSNGIRFLPPDFWRAYDYLSKKWEHQCPLWTPCTMISRNPWHRFRQRVRDWKRHVLRRSQPGKREPDPAVILERLHEGSGCGQE